MPTTMKRKKADHFKKKQRNKKLPRCEAQRKTCAKKPFANVPLDNSSSTCTSKEKTANCTNNASSILIRTHDNGYNISNHVQPEKVLRNKLHPSFPILYLPEYITRRFEEAVLPLEVVSSMHSSSTSFCHEKVDKFSRRDTRKSQKVNSSALQSTFKTDQNVIEAFVRIIVVPLDAGIISHVSYPKKTAIHTITKCNTLHEEAMNTDAPTLSSSCSNGDDSKPSVENYYNKPKAKRKLNEIGQPLDTLIDGIISTLVHRKKTRKWQKKNNDHIHLCFGMNVLSEGYKLASDKSRLRHVCDTLVIQKKRRTSGNSSRNSVADCANMSPGVECVNVNSCASYARSAPEMKLLHEIIGDHGMRELLLNCMVLIPVRDKKDGGNVNDYKNANHFDQGNYLQLSGPPLNMMALTMRPKGYVANVDTDTTLLTDSRDKQVQRCKKVDPFWIVPRHLIFYADTFTKKVGFPPKHLLNQSPDGHLREETLLENMTSVTKSKGKHKCTNGWKRLRVRGLHLCRQVLQNHKRCDYHRLLERNCPMPKLDGCTVEGLVTLYSDESHVVRFFKSAVTKVFPIELWGSTRNLDVVLDGIELFLTMRRKEQMSMSMIMHKIRIKDVEWLFHVEGANRRRKFVRTSHEAATNNVQNVLKWLYCHFLIPLIRSTFYCTDTEFLGNKIVYYRKPVWTRIRKLAMKQLDCQFKPIAPKGILSTLQESTLGFSDLRLLPKTNGIRPLAILCKPDRKLPAHYGILQHLGKVFKGVNVELKDAFHILSFERNQKPHSFGVGLKGFHEVHEKLLEFTMKHRKSCKSDLYFASVDIHHCYDTINQNYLFDIITNLLSKEEYALQNYTLMYPTVDSSAVLRKNLHFVRSPGNVADFFKEAEEIVKDCKKSVSVEMAQCKVVDRCYLLEKISEHLSRNLLVLKDAFSPQLLLQTSGIPQGSILSSLLCNFYYGHIEKQLLADVFHNVSDKHHLLIRIIDDFFLITTCKNTLKRFIDKMSIGDKDLGIQINDRKTRTSHNTNTKVSTQTTLKIGDEYYFQWCGLLFNTKTCEVQVDYGRFAASSASDSLTINRLQNDGHSLVKNMRYFVKPRCIPILFDSRINSIPTVMINFHQMLLISAIKSLHYIEQGLDRKSLKNERFLIDCVLYVIKYAYHLVYSRLRSSQYSGKSQHCCELNFMPYNDALWLGIHSFQTVYVHSKKSLFLSRSIDLSNCLKEIKIKDKSVLSAIADKSLENFDIERFQL
jgi:Telomerase ribonucleoprotein complex - RNA binding domain./Reverse transcriptase (RNA-dependent DNA polymerase).